MPTPPEAKSKLTKPQTSHSKSFPKSVSSHKATTLDNISKSEYKSFSATLRKLQETILAYTDEGSDISLCWERYENQADQKNVKQTIDTVKSTLITCERALQALQVNINLRIAKLNIALQPQSEQYTVNLPRLLSFFVNLNNMVSEQIALVADSVKELDNLSQLIKLQNDDKTSWTMAVLKDFINSHHGRGLKPEEFRPFAQLLLNARKLVVESESRVPFMAFEYLSERLPSTKSSSLRVGV